MASERAALARARELGESVVGATSPNPPVGAVILDVDGVIAGIGATRPPGQEHAEIVALAQAGDRARRGTAVVTLEPCAHTGRTGPCAQALIDAGIARVVYAVPDPNPVAAGGAQVLRRAGVLVEGLAEGDADRLAAERGALRPWLFSVAHGRPLVTWKFAATLDGRVAAADGTSQWITGPEARADVHRLRARVDAVLVGSGTVLADDPQLTVRLSVDDDSAHEPAIDDVHLAATATPHDAALTGAVRQPLRVAIDRRGRIPAGARIFDDAATTQVLDSATPRAALERLYDGGVRHVLLEGGPTLAGAFVAAGCVDEVVAYLAPMLLGAGAAALQDAGIGTLSDALHLTDVTVRQVGIDVRVTGQVLSTEHNARPGAGGE